MWYIDLSLGIIDVKSCISAFWNSLLFIGYRLTDFYISIGNSFNGCDPASFDPRSFSTCYYQKDPLNDGETREFLCAQELEGRFVVIHFSLSRAVALTLCEVQVFGSRVQTGKFHGVCFQVVAQSDNKNTPVIISVSSTNRQPDPKYPTETNICSWCFSEPQGTCYHFHKKPAGSYQLLDQYTEELAFCQEMCIQSPKCTAVGRNESEAQTCVVLGAPSPCETVDVMVNEPYELVVP